MTYATDSDIEAMADVLHEKLSGFNHPFDWEFCRIVCRGILAVSPVHAEIATLREKLRVAEEAKDAAYSERNHVVAALANLFPSGIGRTDIDGWDEGWHGCVYIDLPSGQISYHYHDSEQHLFEHLPTYKGEWDGHDKETVHLRLTKMKEGA
jgi:hypothetical protein